jgi:hypothetical protein
LIATPLLKVVACRLKESTHRRPGIGRENKLRSMPNPAELKPPI